MKIGKQVEAQQESGPLIEGEGAVVKEHFAAASLVGSMTLCLKCATWCM